MNAWDISVTMVRGSKYAEAFRPHYDRTLTDHMAHTASIGGLKALPPPPPERDLIMWQVSQTEKVALHLGSLKARNRMVSGLEGACGRPSAGPLAVPLVSPARRSAIPRRRAARRSCGAGSTGCCRTRPA